MPAPRPVAPALPTVPTAPPVAPRRRALARRLARSGRSIVAAATAAVGATAVGATAAAQEGRGAGWAALGVGDAAEMDIVCSSTWEPVTVVAVVPVPGRAARDYKVRRPDGTEVEFRAPGIVAPCGRPAGGIARERGALGAPPTGVYMCVYRGTPLPAFDFALLDRTTYRDRDGGRGAYRLDAGTRQLVFVSGPMRGRRAQQAGAALFRPLDDGGSVTGITCPHNPARDPHAPRL